MPFQKGQKHSKKWYEVMKGNRNQLSHHTLETRKKMSASRLGEKNPLWKGGFTKSKGYIIINKKIPMSGGKRKFQAYHRFIIEQIIKRPLLRKNKVHHIDFNKTNNDPKNLIAFTSQMAHMKFHWNPECVLEEDIIFDGRKHKSIH